MRRIGLMLMLFIVAVTTLLSQRIVVAVMQDPDFLDPHRAAASGTYEMMFNVFEGLLRKLQYFGRRYGLHFQSQERSEVS